MGWFDWFYESGEKSQAGLATAINESKVGVSPIEQLIGITQTTEDKSYNLSYDIGEKAVWIKSCAGITGGYIYIVKPSGKLLGDEYTKLDIPKGGCREDTIDRVFFDEDGRYIIKIADYNNITKVEKQVTISKDMRIVLPGTSTTKNYQSPFNWNDLTIQIIAGLIVAVVLYLVLKQK